MFEKKQNKVLEDLFLREKPALILLALKAAKGSVYATILSKESDCTYSHTIKILDVLKKYDVVTFEKKGRIKMVTLTDDGWDIAHNLEGLQKKLSQIEEKKNDKPQSGPEPKQETEESPQEKAEN